MTVVLMVLCALAAVFLVAEIIIFIIAFWGRVYHDITKSGELDKPKYSMYKDLILDGIRTINEMPCEDVSIRSDDGLRLSGRFYRNQRERGLLLLCHGYRSIAENDFSCAFEEFFRLGFSVLLIDERAHGRSQGHIMTFGIRERHDVRLWTQYLAERFPGEPIIAEGISMGASTVLMASGEGFPEEVRGIIVDCGYESPREVICHVLRRSHVPVEPLYWMCRLSARIFGGFDLEVCSAREEGSKSRLPALFIHGESDYLVPCAQGRRNYEAYGGKKTIVTVPGAGHGMSYLVDTPRVCEAIERFVDETLT